jgi:succinyl-CoA synthetase beta subunit
MFLTDMLIFLYVEIQSIGFQVPIDVFKGITDEDAAKVVDGLALKAADRQSSIEQIKKLYELFCKCDCTLLEVCIEKWLTYLNIL